MTIGSAYSQNNTKIRLTSERWYHIAKNHPELQKSENAIISNVENPDFVVQANDMALMAVTKRGEKFLVVVYKEDIKLNDGFIITAFVTSKIEKVTKRPLVWKKN